ncbi:hypothetical protein T10_1724 [Trichinella papuae]|uniref:Uncharacterized protein n=1 Tax=Trichinella papuae TaxID=268474 RepID=A0A0V1N265_9BILA|nr:hypothetical protein T10_1724 [Trichinella papuae]
MAQQILYIFQYGCNFLFFRLYYFTLITTIYIFYNIVTRRISRPVPRLPCPRVFVGRRHSPSTLRQCRVVIRNV